MDVGNLPLWAQQLSAILLTLGTAMALRWNEKRKPEKPAAPEGDTTVVAASFVEKRLMERLIEAVLALNGNVIDLNEHVQKMNNRLHEDELVRAAVARMREEHR